MPTYLEKFQDLVDALKREPTITVMTFAHGAPCASAAVDAFAKKRNIDPKVLAFWLETDGLTLEWLKSGGDFDLLSTRSGPATGRIEILSLERIAEAADVDGTHRIDGHQPEGGAAARFDGSANPTVFYVESSSTDAHPLKVGIPGYLELVLRTAGLAEWFNWVAPDCAPPPDRTLVKKIFPNFKSSELKAILKEHRA